MWAFPGVGVLVFEKSGLKRGPALNNASFSLSPSGWPNSIEKLVGPSPLPGPGGNPLYHVTLRVWAQPDGRYDPLFLVVTAPGHYPASYPFREADFEARLDRR